MLSFPCYSPASQCSEHSQNSWSSSSDAQAGPLLSSHPGYLVSNAPPRSHHLLWSSLCNCLQSFIRAQQQQQQKFNRSLEIVSCLYMQNRWAPLADCSFTFSIPKSSDKYFILYSHSFFLWSFVPPACLPLIPVVFPLKIAALPLSTNFSIWTTHKLHTSYSFVSLLVPQPLVFVSSLGEQKAKEWGLLVRDDNVYVINVPTGKIHVNIFLVVS